MTRIPKVRPRHIPSSWIKVDSNLRTSRAYASYFWTVNADMKIATAINNGLFDANRDLNEVFSAAQRGEYANQQELLDAAQVASFFPFLIFQQEIAGMMLTRFVSNVQQYFVQILSELMRKHPEAIDPKIIAGVEYTRHEGETEEQIRQGKLEFLIERLTYAGFDKLKKKLAQFGLPFEDGTGMFDRIVAERNLIIHNGWRVDASFVQNFPASGYIEGDQLRLNLFNLYDRIHPLLFIAAPMDDYVTENFLLVEKIDLSDHLRSSYADRLNALIREVLALLTVR